jgi:hypothetical protein
MKLFCLLLAGGGLLSAADLRLGIVGTDTSHAVAFTKILNDPSSPDYIPGARVVAAFKGGSPDVKESWSRVNQYAEELKTKWNVEIVDSIPALCAKVDAVLLESVDGRPHLEQARAIIKAGKPMFIDKPLSSNYEDALEIAALARKAGVPWFTSSSLRFAKSMQGLTGRDAISVMTWGPGPQEPHHELDMTWYGVHAVEMLYTLMGTGCVEVSRLSSPQADVVTGRWKDGRLGTVQLARPYGPFGAAIIRQKSAQQTPEKFEYSYVSLVQEIVKFFGTKQAPVAEAETLEMFAFMEAAQKSYVLGGQKVALRPAR